jgi:DNA-binding CsgD family transcriptional regulator
VRAAVVAGPGNAGLVPVPDLRPLLSSTRLDAQECTTVFRALGETTLQATSADLVADSSERLATAHRALSLQHDLREHVGRVRSAAFARVQQVLADARNRYAAAELLARSAELLCASCDLDRALLSRVEGSTWVPGAVHVVDGLPIDPPADLRVVLGGGLLEAEAVRRRQALLVRDARNESRTDPGFMAWLAPRSYIAVPLVLGDRVVGLLHAHDSTGRKLTSMDRDLVATFAYELARTYEHAALTERFAQHRGRVRAALAAVDDTFDGLRDEPAPAVVRFTRRAPVLVGAAEVPAPAALGGRLDALSDRELEVLGLMAQGATNLQVAVRLVVSESTVKSHVKQILRKLVAGNRAEAVYLFLREGRAG